MVKSSAGDRIFIALTYLVASFAVIATLFPLLYVLIVSFTPYSTLLESTGIVIIPKEITLNAYHYFLSNPTLPYSYANSVFVTVVGTSVNMLCTLMFAYPISKPYLPGRKIFISMAIFTMLFGGGLIPTYLVVKGTGLVDSLWALIFPTAISTYNLMIVKSFFENVPPTLDESARIDGASNMLILFRIYIPLSLPMIATVGMFYAVYNWNVFLEAILYLTDPLKYPLQVVLRSILGASQIQTTDPDFLAPTRTMQMAAVVLTVLPIIIVYPFIQKYFTKGVMLGAVKG